jgi:hypothetical protein
MGVHVLEDLTYKNSIITGISLDKDQSRVVIHRGSETEVIPIIIPFSSPFEMNILSASYMDDLPRFGNEDEFTPSIDGDIVIGENGDAFIMKDSQLFQISRGRYFYDDKIISERYFAGDYYTEDSVIYRNGTRYKCLSEHMSSNTSFTSENWREIKDSEYMYAECEALEVSLGGVIETASREDLDLIVLSMQEIFAVVDWKKSNITEEFMYANSHFSGSELNINMMTNGSDRFIALESGDDSYDIKRVECTFETMYQGYEQSNTCGLVLRDSNTQEIIKENILFYQHGVGTVLITKDRSKDSLTYDIIDSSEPADDNTVFTATLDNISDFNDSTVEIYLSAEKLSQFKIKYN